MTRMTATMTILNAPWREYHGRNPKALPLLATVQGFLPGFTGTAWRESRAFPSVSGGIS